METDAAGYFAFELTPEAVKATAQSKLSVLVRAADVQLVPAAAEPVVIAAGATRVMDVQLSSAELEKLRLRMPFSPDKIVVRPPDVVVTPASDKPPVKDPPVRDPPVKNPAPIETKDPVKPVTPVEPAKPRRADQAGRHQRPGQAGHTCRAGQASRADQTDRTDEAH